MNRALIAVAVLAATAWTTGLGYAYARRADPVLFTFVPEPDAVQPITFSLMNPFRDRKPEAAAESVLRELRSGNFDSLLPLLDEERRAHVLMRERQYPIRRWRVREREDDAKQVKVTYWVTRDGYESETYVTLWLDRQGNRLVLSQYGAVY